MIPLGGLLGVLAVDRNRFSRPTPAAAVFFIWFVADVAIAVLRQGSSLNIWSAKYSVVYALFWIALSGALAAAVLYSDRSRWPEYIRLAVLAAPAVYVTVNVLMSLAHVAAPNYSAPSSYGSAQILALLGFHSSRATFPLALSPNSFGVGGGAAVVTAVVLAVRFRRSRRIRIAAIAAAAIAFYCVLATDSRGSLVAVVVAILCALWLPRSRAGRALLFVPVVVLVVSPWFVLDLAHWLGENSALGGALSRTASTLGTASDRQFVWSPALQLIHQMPSSLIFGYGSFGQTTSGVSAGYAYLFHGQAQAAATTSLHNLMLQTVFDSGLVGFAAFVGIVWVSVRRLARTATVEPTAAAALAGVLYFVLAGYTEATPAIYSPDALVAFIGFVSFALIPSRRASRTELARRDPDFGLIENRESRLAARSGYPGGS
jgi:O-antigen ligase